MNFKHIKLIVAMLFKFVLCISFSNNLAPSCRCMRSNDLVGNKKCNTKEKIGNSSLPACYVILPSNCSFIANSTKYIGLQISSDPCKGNKISTD